jgi:hypothetical protein
MEIDTFSVLFRLDINPPVGSPITYIYMHILNQLLINLRMEQSLR